MFTGIIQALGKVIHFSRENEVARLGIEIPGFLLTDIKLGSSISIDGVCLTVVSCQESVVFFDVLEETLSRTTLGTYKLGQRVNVERAAKFGDEIGGHFLSGHIFATAEIVKIEGNVYTLRCDKSLIKYFFPKGYIALDGISLTLVAVDKQNALFSVHLIPETLQRTTLGSKKVKDLVNLEIDALTQATVDAVESFVKENF